MRFSHHSGYRVEVTQQPSDGSHVTLTGDWGIESDAHALSGDLGTDASIPDGEGSVAFVPRVNLAGSYEVYVHYSSGADRSDEVPIDIQYHDEAAVLEAYEQSSGHLTDGYGYDDYLYSDYVTEEGDNYSTYGSIDFYGGYEHHYGSTYFYDTGTEEYYDYFVYHDQGGEDSDAVDTSLATSLSIDERIGGNGTWVYLGTYFFDADQESPGLVEVGNTGPGVVTLDAIRLVGSGWPDVCLLYTSPSPRDP